MTSNSYASSFHKALAIVALCGVAASARAQAVPTYTIQTRWKVEGAAGSAVATAATAVVLTLEGRAIFNGSFPADSPGTAGPRYGNFGVYSLGFGPSGSAAASTVTRSGCPTASALQRGDWGTFVSTGNNSDPNNPVPPTTYGPLRGAAPGNFFPGDNAGNGAFRGGLRFFSSPTPAINNPVGNSASSSDAVNGRFDGAGNLTDFNLLRDDFQSGGAHARNQINGTNTTEPGTPIWNSIYRVTIVSPEPVYADPQGSLAVDFNGYLRAGTTSQFIGAQWVLGSGGPVQSSTSIRLRSTSSDASVASQPAPASAYVGETVTISASFNAPQSSTPVWRRGTPPTPVADPRFSVSNTFTPPNTFTSTLTIQSASLADTDAYSCQLATNACSLVTTNAVSVAVITCPKSWSFRTTQTTPPPRKLHAMTVRGNDILMYGGAGQANQALGDLWKFDGTNWQPVVTVGPTPPPRIDATLAALPDGRVLLFGGKLGTADIGQPDPVVNDTWLLTGNSWLQVATPPTLGPRGGHVMVYDSVRGEVLMFGGYGRTDPTQPLYNDLWAWKPTTGWQQRLPISNAPPSRYAPGAAFDGSRLVLFGGWGVTNPETGAFGVIGDTWAWDGTNWTALTAPGPSPQYYAMMARTTAGTGGLLMVNGSATDQNIWLLGAGSTTWTPVATQCSPGARLAAQMVMIPGTDTPLVFGGLRISNPQQALNDLWDYRTGPCLCIDAPVTNVVQPGGTVVLQADTCGIAGQTVTWQRPGGPVLQGNPLTITNFNPANGGLYQATVSRAGCGATTSQPILITSKCSRADVAAIGGAVYPDGMISVDDVIVFLNAFFAGNTSIADIVRVGGTLPGDGQLTADDIISFLSGWFAGCIP